MHPVVCLCMYAPIYIHVYILESARPPVFKSSVVYISMNNVANQKVLPSGVQSFFLH